MLNRYLHLSRKYLDEKIIFVLTFTQGTELIYFGYSNVCKTAFSTSQIYE